MNEFIMIKNIDDEDFYSCLNSALSDLKQSFNQYNDMHIFNVDNKRASFSLFSSDSDFVITESVLLKLKCLIDSKKINSFSYSKTKKAIHIELLLS